MVERRRGGDENSGPLQSAPAELSGCGLQVLSTPQPLVESHPLQLALKRERRRYNCQNCQCQLLTFLLGLQAEMEVGSSCFHYLASNEQRNVNLQQCTYIK